MENFKPTVTVFMAAYNAREYIREAINSILNQTYNNFELLIVDDGSTDDTSLILKEFDDERIRIIENKKNQGLTYTRNIALTEAKGEFLAIMDSDDVSLPDRLKIQIAAFRINPSLALYGGQAKVIDYNSKEIGMIHESETDPELLKIRLLFQNTFVHSSVMMRTEVFREMNGYQEQFAEDYDLFLRIAHKYPVANSSAFVVLYRTHDNNISRKHGNEIVNRLLPIKEKVLIRSGLPSDINHQKMLTNPFIWFEIPIQTYRSFYSTLILNNRDNKIYNEELFEQYIFNRWYDVITHMGGINTFTLFFVRPLFKWKYCSFKRLLKMFQKSFKQFRKAFKRSLKHLLGITK